jgi:hypothetical protein
MKTFKELLRKLYACSNAIEWAADMTIEEVVEKCHRGDWLLWLAKKIDIDMQKLTLAKGHCAATVLHLMKDDRSKAAVQAAIDFGEGKITRKDLDNAACVAADAAYDAAYAAAAAKNKNEQQTADICRKYIGSEIITKVNEILKKQP